MNDSLTLVFIRFKIAFLGDRVFLHLCTLRSIIIIISILYSYILKCIRK